MTVSVDATRCIGCGMCAYTAPAVFALCDRVSTVTQQPDKSSASRVFDAANGCPVNAIRIQRTPRLCEGV